MNKSRKTRRTFLAGIRAGQVVVLLTFRGPATVSVASSPTENLSQTSEALLNTRLGSAGGHLRKRRSTPMAAERDVSVSCSADYWGFSVFSLYFL